MLVVMGRHVPSILLAHQRLLRTRTLSSELRTAWDTPGTRPGTRATATYEHECSPTHKVPPGARSSILKTAAPPPPSWGQSYHHHAGPVSGRGMRNSTPIRGRGGLCVVGGDSSGVITVITICGPVGGSCMVGGRACTSTCVGGGGGGCCQGSCQGRRYGLVGWRCRLALPVRVQSTSASAEMIHCHVICDSAA